MKILFINHRFPFPPKRGGKIRPFNIISHLSQNHEVTVASIVRSNDEANEGKGLNSYCHDFIMENISRPKAVLNMTIKLFGTSPSSMGYFYSPRLEARIQERLSKDKFDLIIVHCSSVAQYVKNISKIPKILDFGDMDSQKWLAYARSKPFPLSLGYFLEGVKLERAEKKLAAKFDSCTCTTRAEWETLNSYQVPTHSDWFPNGVDIEYFKPAKEPCDQNRLSFIGRMDYYPNQDCMFYFCKNVFPLLQEQKPEIKLFIVGADPSQSVKDLGNIPGVTVTGSVDDVRPYVLKSAVNIAPLNIARGTQNKILEAMAMGVPVVASRLAAGGIDAIPDKHFLVASSPQQYREAILNLLDNPEARNKLSKAGRTRVLTHHSWANSLKRFDDIIENCIAQYQGH